MPFCGNSKFHQKKTQPIFPSERVKSMENSRPCPECRSATSILEGMGDGPFKFYRCGNGHLIQVDTRDFEILSITFPFKELQTCPECGRTGLKKVHDQKYPEQDGIHRLVVFVCPASHRTYHRQLVVKQYNVPPKKLWEGYT